MGRALAGLTVLLILVLAAAFAAPALIDWNDYRSSIEKAASQILGRTVRIDGPINISILPEPHIQFSKVTITDPTSKLKVPLASIEAVDMVISLQALTGGRLEAQMVRVTRPELLVDLSHLAAPSFQPPLGGDADFMAKFVTSAAVRTVEIKQGRAAFIARNFTNPRQFLFDDIAGVISVPQTGGGYRFAGSFSRQREAFDLKFSTSDASLKAIKLTGALTHPASKTAVQADGAITLSDGPIFEGTVQALLPTVSLAAPAPEDGSAAPLSGMQAKSAVHVDLEEASFSDLTVTLDPQNRPQILTGSGLINFGSDHAEMSLQAKSLDADLLLLARSMSLPEPAAASPSAPSQPAFASWAPFEEVTRRLFWLRPSTSLRLSIGADQLQLHGDLLEGFQWDAERTGNRWVFEKLLLKLPGETGLKISGTLTKTDQNDIPTLSGIIDLSGKNLGRLARWLTPGSAQNAHVPTRAFALKGSVSYSGKGLSLEGVKGSLGGTPFSASLRYEKEPAKKLFLTLSGDTIDLNEFGSAFDPSDAASLANASRLGGTLTQSLSTLDGADLDLGIGVLRSGSLEAKNLSARIKMNAQILTVSKLNLETADGLTLHGEGEFPLKSSSQGKFEGRIDAKTASALKLLAATAGYDASAWTQERFESLAPASFTATYITTATGDATLQTSGSFAGTRVDGRGQFKSKPAAADRGLIGLQLDAAAPDGNKLLTQVFARDASESAQSPLPLAAPGTATLRLSGAADALRTSFLVKTAPLQMQFEGTSDWKASASGFTGQISVTSSAADRFLPGQIANLIGADGQGNFHLDAALTVKPELITVDKIKAQTPHGALTGRFSWDTSGSVPRFDADLSADQFMVAPLSNSLLIARAPLSPAALAADLTGFWPERPFSLQVLQNTAARLSLKAKTLKLSDSLALTDGVAIVSLDKGRLDLQKLEGKLLDGTFTASGELAAQETGVTATGTVLLVNADMAAFATKAKQPILNGKVSVFLDMSGKGLSPRGLASSLSGKGHVELTDGQIAKISPAAVQKAGDDLQASPAPITEAMASKGLLEAVQSKDFKYRHLKAGLAVRDGVIELRRASFRNREGTVRLEAFLDVAKMRADATWQLGVRADRKSKWPGVKLIAAGPLSGLGEFPLSLNADDFTRAVIVKKMERDINHLESLGKDAAGKAAPARATNAWQPQTLGPSPAPKRTPPAPQAPKTSGSPATPDAAPSSSDFETRMRDALRGQSAPQ